MEIKVGMKLRDTTSGDVERTVTAILPDGRFELSTWDPRTRGGTRKTRAKRETIERSYVPVEEP